ncbi:hypothetical protein AMTR_s03533p00002360, partial [Amborella trichopoda]
VTLFVIENCCHMEGSVFPLPPDDQSLIKNQVFLSDRSSTAAAQRNWHKIAFTCCLGVNLWLDSEVSSSIQRLETPA